MGATFAKRFGFKYNAEELLNEIQQGNDSQARRVLKRNTTLRECILPNGESVLTAVISNQCYLSLHYLLSKGVSVNKYDERGHTAIQTACCKGDHKVVTWLLEKRADPNQVCIGHLELDLYHVSPVVLLELWKEVHSQDEWRYFIERFGSLPNAKDSYLTFPLLASINHKEVDCIQRLIAAGVNLHIRDRLGNTPLLLATIHNNTNAVELLTKEMPDRVDLIDLDLPNILGARPLQYAAIHSNGAIVDSLVKRGCNVRLFDEVSITDPDLLFKTLTFCPNDPPLFVSVCQRNKAIVKHLLDAGASAKTVLPMFLARRVASSGNDTAFIETQEGVDILKLLISAIGIPMECMVDDFYKQFNNQIIVPSVYGQKWDLLQVIYDVGLNISEDALETIWQHDQHLASQWHQWFPRPSSLKNLCRIRIRGILNSRIFDIEHLDIPKEIKVYISLQIS